ncbi:periplasmic heavy metal sensor [Actibacterium sp. XHP0104]|uniref:periplasmic heavy metal sensor n=1 Tax=Actibacterium sp. XHP0104 TaxID=2984335 RepID=UPI0021E6FBCD|nr:periplasmic heavy metal sensor [Actibacterium sp. XHP0104]MCV2881394.1 periplasmic heavy metal sensor [Actibacterium sp. XHP0104]
MSGEGGKPAGKFRWGRVVLVLSLGLNLLVFGLIGGAILKHGGPPSRAAGQVDFLGYSGPYARALDHEQREHLRDRLGQSADTWRENRAAVRRDFQLILTALRARPYDAAALEAALEAQQARVDAHARQIRAEMLAQIAAMDDHDRHEFAERLERMLRRGARHGHDRDDD